MRDLINIITEASEDVDTKALNAELRTIKSDMRALLSYTTTSVSEMAYFQARNDPTRLAFWTNKYERQFQMLIEKNLRILAIKNLLGIEVSDD